MTGEASHRFIPIRCILPPHILRSIAEKGRPEQRTKALQTLATDGTFRALRAGMPTKGQAVRRRFGALAAEGEKQRTIFDAHSTQTLPGDVVRIEGSQPTGDPAVNEAYDGLGVTYDLFWEVYDRNSIDDDGMALNATVHFGQEYNNAFWNGERMVFGDGDGDLVLPLGDLDAEDASVRHRLYGVLDDVPDRPLHPRGIDVYSAEPLAEVGLHFDPAGHLRRIDDAADEVAQIY